MSSGYREGVKMSATVTLSVCRPTLDITITDTPTDSLRHSEQRRCAALTYWMVH